MNDQQQNNLNQSEQDASNTNENVTSGAIDLSKSRLQTQADNSTTLSGVDDLQSNNNFAAATDKADAAEQKTYGDIDLNKGLEAQAKDEEL